MTLQVGLVGCGRLAELGYLPAFAGTGGVRLAAVAEPDPDRRTRFAALAGDVAQFADARSLLEARAADALVLASPVTAHLPDARVAAEFGVPLLVEKPPAPDAVSAAELGALEPAPWVGFNRRFDPAVAALRNSLGAVGPLELRLELHYRRPSWSAHTVADDALLDLGPHVIDLARWLTGSEVTAVCHPDLTPERARFTLVLERGQAFVDLATDRPHHELVEAIGPSGQLLGRHRAGGLVNGVLARVDPRRRPHPLAASLAGQLDAFSRALRGDAHPDLGTAADGLAVMEVVDRVRAAASNGAPRARAKG